MYDPFTGRFLQQDPLEDFFPGESPYGYAYHNPVMFDDPTGLAPEKEKGGKGDVLLDDCGDCFSVQMAYYNYLNYVTQLQNSAGFSDVGEDVGMGSDQRMGGNSFS